MVKKLFKRLSLGIVGIGLFIGFQQLIELTTWGFCLQKIFAPDLRYNPAWEVSPLKDEHALDDLLDQPYFFLRAGSECFAFLSEDGQTVIKFFKLDYTRPFYFRRGLFLENHADLAGTLSTTYSDLPTMPTFVDTMAKRLLGMREFRIGRTMRSLKFAYDHLKEETGLIYLHLNPTHHLHKTLILFDANSIAHHVNLDTTHFVLQHRAHSLTTFFLKAKRSKNDLQAQQGIDSFMQLILGRCKKGFADRDAINRNFGFIGTQSIETDSGSFISYPPMQQPRLYKQELFFTTLELREWIVKHYPDLLPYFDTKLEEELTRA